MARTPYQATPGQTPTTIGQGVQNVNQSVQQAGGQPLPVPGQPTQQTGVKSPAQMQQLVNTLAQSEMLGTGQLMQQEGQKMMYAPGGGKKDNWRNALAGSIRGHRGRKKVDAAIALEEKAMAEKQQKLQTYAKAQAAAVLQQTGNQAMADAVYQQAMMGQPVDLSKMGMGGVDLGDVNSLQDQINKTIGKDFRGRTEAMRDIVTFAEQGTGFADHALIFRYMKFLDPNSTVREGEFATVEQTGSIPDRVVTMYNKALEGDKLTDKQRNDLVTAVVSAYPGYVEQYQRELEPFKTRANQYRVSLDQLSIPQPYEIGELNVAQNGEEPPPAVIQPGVGEGEVITGANGVSVVKGADGRNVWTRGDQ